jgi:hemerythrin-like domain-containing protein
MKMRSSLERPNGQPLNSIAELMVDHGGIDAMCSVLDAGLTRMEQGRDLDRQMLSGLLLFFDRFVGRSHYVKEERGLFPLLREAGAEPAAVLETLVAQHAEHRAMVAELGAMLEQLPRASGGLQSTFLTAGRRYIASVRGHLRMEDEQLPGMCAAVVQSPQDESLCRQFAVIERSALGPTGREWYHQVIADYHDIVATWGSAFDVTPGHRTNAGR